MKRVITTTGLTCAALLSIAGSASADPSLRVQVDQKGDFVLIGNTLGHDCAVNAASVIVGTVGACGAMGSTADTEADVFWRSDSPAAGAAAANDTITAAMARSTAVLNIPNGATITHAYLYWGARNNALGADMTAVLEREGVFTQNINATVTYQNAVGNNNFYQSGADVTALVQANGPGAYRVGGVDMSTFPGSTNLSMFGGWWMAVFYSLDSEPPRNLALFDGFDIVNANTDANVTIGGFNVPMAGFDAKLGVIAFEGDSGINGDQLFFGGGAALTNGENPANNFFNSTRSFLGNPVSNVGDLPQLSGTAQSLSGVDIDVVNVTSKLTGGQMMADIQATSSQDTYFLVGFVTSISTFKPDFSTSQKSVVDVNGGSVLPGEVLEYTIVVTNTGNDNSVDTVLTDPIPNGVTYVPGSLEITTGPNMGPLTDIILDDQGDYNGLNTTLTVRLGTGANGLQGGTLTPGQSTTIKFQVTVDNNATGTIENQATITAAGEQGAPEGTDVTDGNGNGNGQPPTVIEVAECMSDADCMAPTPYCNTAANPSGCVECLMDSQCTPTEPTCSPLSNSCVCIPLALEMCGDGIDNNCDGNVDEICDDDMDGLVNFIEVQIGTDPQDADSDDDGVKDGDEPGVLVGDDADGDGLPNALDPDSDNDGLFDGTELGFGCDDPATDASKGNCTPDADKGATTTNPLDADTDDGGVTDGNEDKNLNGMIDVGETDPNEGSDDGMPADQDKDGLSDDLEVSIGTNPMDADSDDDGLSDGEEPNPSADSDGDGLINGLDPDSDNDGLFDGTELGKDCSNPDTDMTVGNCRPDADGGATTTSPIDPDTDDGGVSDGSEDGNLDGQVDPGETDPNDESDDSMVVDSDGDGLSDVTEGTLGSDPNDADSDNDGLLDGDEPNPGVDTDGDNMNNITDWDSDGDGLFDGTELGKDCSNPATDVNAMHCVPDGDSGATTTNPLDADTDDGGISDGVEDANKNGVIDQGELDPNNPADDASVVTCMADGDCGDATSGRVCDDSSKVCVDGCRGEGGNGCPSGQVCSSTDATIGTCSDGAGGGGGAGGQGGSGAGGNRGGIFGEGSGCLCGTKPVTSGGGNAWLLLALAGGMLVRRGRRGR